MISVRVGKDPLRHGLDLHSVHILDHRYVDAPNEPVHVVSHTNAVSIEQASAAARRRRVNGRGILARGWHEGALVSLSDLPQLDCFVVCGEQKVRLVLAPEPLDLVDLFLDLQRL